MTFSTIWPGKRPLLTICIPAYRPQDFLERVLTSVQAQTFRDFRVVISNDGGFERESFERFRRVANVRIHHQPGRLGWVENANWLIRRVKTPYFAILPQDDTIEPDYYAALVDLLEKTPAAGSACTAIQTVGRPDEHIIRSKNVIGDLAERVSQVFGMSYAGVSFRAVNRTPANLSDLTVPGNRFDNMFADSTWIMRQAIQGDMLYLDRPLYKKLYHSGNTHLGWLETPARTLALAWMRYCLQMAIYAARSMVGETQREAIGDLACKRAFSRDSGVRPLAVSSAFDATWSQSEQDLRRDRMKTALWRSLLQGQGGCNTWRRYMHRLV
ncbi:glycosyltransferase family 2 protein [Roseibium sp. FZY0029]|uniref:glycosyltransferase family 2 protein n=1 Tax=Roseibium sp. FZY0029 TaxID=3116647 RepID=UPI002E9834EC|nr:glycosyltransferase family 2 protein [Roseibium sp. FZY0029]